jgi:hypothetical protein
LIEHGNAPGCVDGRGDEMTNGHEKRGNGKMGGGVSLELVGKTEYQMVHFNMKIRENRALSALLYVCLCVLKNIDLCLQFFAF